jgi:serine/threonine protein phosphatase PrpC
MGGHAGGAEAAAMVAAALVTVRPAHPGGTLDGDDGLDPNAEWAVRYSGAQVFTDAAWCGSTTVEDTLAAAWKAWFEGLSARVQAAGEALGTPEMGATTAVLGVTERGVTVVNVGDCRVYWLNHGRLGPLSTDDRTGDPRSSTVTQAIGGSKRIDPHFYPIAPHPPGSTRFVLCSDGVWGALDQGALRDLSAAGGRPEQVAEAIVQGACRAGARDNCSAVVADVHVGPPELGQPGLGGEDIAAGAAFPVPAEQPPARQTRRWAWGTRTRGDEL